MKPKKLIAILSLCALVIAGAFGAVAYHSANASSLTLNPSSVIANQPVNVDTYGKGSGGGYTNADLAKALAITVDELTAAQKTANESVLAQAVEKGLITQAQADKLKSNAAGFSLGHLRGLLSSADLTAAGIDYDTELAKALGITAEKVTPVGCTGEKYQFIILRFAGTDAGKGFLQFNNFGVNLPL